MTKPEQPSRPLYKEGETGRKLTLKLKKKKLQYQRNNKPETILTDTLGSQTKQHIDNMPKNMELIYEHKQVGPKVQKQIESN